MQKTTIELVTDKVAALPKETQEEVLVMVTEIEEELDNELDLSPDDLIAIEQSGEEVRAGRTVPFEEVQKILQRYMNA